MPSLHDLAIDLINDAKGAKNVAAKLYNLEQIKEIAFHRDTSILSEIAPDIINNFMVERSSNIRRFLVTFAADWLLIDFPAALPLSLSLYGFLLASESGDGPLRQISTELTKIYDRIVMHITGLPIKTRTSGPNVADPKSYWSSLRTIVSRLIDMISSDRSELLRAQSLKLAENMILFGLPVEKLSSDPRLAKSRPQSGDSSKGMSAGDIPLHHPFINRNDLEQEAESIFSKMLLWASKGGPQGHPFSPAQMALLGGNIANIASLRPKKSTNAATALVQVLQGKGSMCHLMTKEDRDNLARNIQKLLRATYASPDPDKLMSKLRTSLEGLVALAPAVVETLEPTSGIKRPIGDAEDNDGLESGGLGSTELRASAIAAVDALENNIKTKTAKLEIIQPSGPVGIVVQGSVNGNGNVAVINTVSVDTELSGELSSFPDIIAGLKLVTLQAPSAVVDTLSALTPIATGMTSLSGMIMRPSSMSSDSYTDLALHSMKRIMDTFQEIKNFGTKAYSAHMKLSVRMVLSMTILNLAESRGLMKVSLFTSLSNVAADFLSEGLPQEVSIPRCLWAVISHILKGNLSAHSSQTKTAVGLCEESVKLLIFILTELYNRTNLKKTVFENGSPDLLGKLYQDVSLVILARLLQGIESRAAAKEIFMALTYVPSGCLALLNLLVHTGTRAVVPPQGVRRAVAGPRNRGTRTEAINLLGQLVFSSDEIAGYAALNRLLWCAVTDDFEVRSKAVALLVGEIVPGEESVYESVTLFAVHSMIAVIGEEQVVKRTTELSQLQLEVEVEVEEVIGMQEQLDSDENKREDLESKMEIVSDVLNMTGDVSSEVQLEVQPDDIQHDPNHSNEVEVEVEVEETTLKSALEKYEKGRNFDGTFLECKNLVGGYTSGGREKTELHVKKSVHLLAQLCVSEPLLLKVLCSLYGAAAAISKEINLNLSLNLAGNSLANQLLGEEGSSVSVNVTPTTGDKKTKIENKYSIICDIIHAEFGSIVPIISKRQDSFSFFTMLTKNDSDPYIQPLIELALETVHSDFTIPPNADLINAVKSYSTSAFFLRSIDGYEREILYQKEIQNKLKNQSTNEVANANKIEIENSELMHTTFEEKKTTAALQLYIPLLGGFSPLEIIEILPKLLKVYNEEPETLKNVFRRIHSARPPPLSKATLFAALHRIDCEVSGLKQKIVLDVISLCLGNKEDFRSDTIRDALTDLLQDGIPAQALMRTAILSAQSYGNEMKKFILSDVVPSLIRGKVWNSAPKVWEGVSYAVKIFSEHKNVEPTLRCLLGLPGIQLKSVLKAAPKVKPLLSNLLKSLSVEEKEECISGRWAGLAAAVVSSVNADGVVSAEDAVVDNEKLKIIKELSAA